MAEKGLFDRELNRRELLKTVGGGALLLGAGSLAAACGVNLKGSGQGSSGKIVIGYVSPQTGEAAVFATSDNFLVDTVRRSSAYKNGFKVGGKKYDVEIVVKDTQSSPNRASEVARELILSEHADMILTSSAPEVTNPVATVCEANGIPCVSTVVPWESWYFGRGAKPGQTFTYTTCFFFGLKEFAGCFVPMWNRIPNNKIVAEMYPNDADGNAFRQNFPPLIKAAGYTPLDGGAYTDGTTDYSGMISKFKGGPAQVFSNVPLPPDFNTFWKQAVQQGYKPKIATVAKVLLFPSDVAALGDLVINIATDAWWTPYHPYTSTLTGQTAQAYAAEFESQAGQQWVQTLGSGHSLFEIAKVAFEGAANPRDRKAVAAQLRTLSYTGISGPVDFSKGPVPGVAIIPPLGVQWKKGTKYPYEMAVVDNSLAPNVPTNGALEPTNA
ncbi:MAG: ABC transporter substrate-binding protein [Candidatus Dormibacterales bacterium]